MALPNRISAAFTTEQQTACDSALKNLNTNLPFLLSIDNAERDSTIHLKDKNRQFVRSSYELVKAKSGFLPRDFNIDEYGKDVVLFDALYTFRQNVAGLLQRIDDTLVVAGGEAYVASLVVYSSANSSNVGTEGIDPFLDDLTRRFSRKNKGGKLGGQANPAK